MGAELAREAPADADVVVPFRFSASGRNRLCARLRTAVRTRHYPQPLCRTHLHSPTQSIRELGVRMKHNANRAVVEGKRVVLDDHSVVRGTTSIKIMQMMRDAGRARFTFASRLTDHLARLLRHRHARARQLLAARMDLEGMRQLCGAAARSRFSLSTKFIAPWAIRAQPRQPQFTDDCFTGDYPTRLVDQFGDPARQQLSLLAEAS